MTNTEILICLGIFFGTGIFFLAVGGRLILWAYKKINEPRGEITTKSQNFARGSWISKIGSK